MGQHIYDAPKQNLKIVGFFHWFLYGWKINSTALEMHGFFSTMEFRIQNRHKIIVQPTFLGASILFQGGVNRMCHPKNPWKKEHTPMDWNLIFDRKSLQPHLTPLFSTPPYRNHGFFGWELLHHLGTINMQIYAQAWADWMMFRSLKTAAISKYRGCEQLPIKWRKLSGK